MLGVVFIPLSEFLGTQTLIILNLWSERSFKDCFWEEQKGQWYFKEGRKRTVRMIRWPEEIRQFREWDGHWQSWETQRQGDGLGLEWCVWYRVLVREGTSGLHYLHSEVHIQVYPICMSIYRIIVLSWEKGRGVEREDRRIEGDPEARVHGRLLGLEHISPKLLVLVPAF